MSCCSCLRSCGCLHLCWYFFCNDTATTEIYTLSLHDALPILGSSRSVICCSVRIFFSRMTSRMPLPLDRKSTRLNSSHLGISYAVFCLKKKKNCRRKSHCRIMGDIRTMHTNAYASQQDGARPR